MKKKLEKERVVKSIKRVCREIKIPVTRAVKSKRVYSRKVKHKGSGNE